MMKMFFPGEMSEYLISILIRNSFKMLNQIILTPPELPDNFNFRMCKITVTVHDVLISIFRRQRTESTKKLCVFRKKIIP